MPWCGFWGVSGPAYWWVLPLIGIAFMGMMLFVCSRGCGCMMGPRRSSGGPSDSRRDVDLSKDDSSRG